MKFTKTSSFEPKVQLWPNCGPKLLGLISQDLLYRFFKLYSMIGHCQQIKFTSIKFPKKFSFRSESFYLLDSTALCLIFWQKPLSSLAVLSTLFDCHRLYLWRNKLWVKFFSLFLWRVLFIKLWVRVFLLFGQYCTPCLIF